jgi:ribosomal protein S11
MTKPEAIMILAEHASQQKNPQLLEAVCVAVADIAPNAAELATKALAHLRECDRAQLTLSRILEDAYAR